MIDESKDHQIVAKADGTFELLRKLRYRVNVSTTSKGAKSFDTTVDGEGFTMEEILERSDALVSALDERYPPPESA